jgi:hypothetical protein
VKRKKIHIKCPESIGSALKLKNPPTIKTKEKTSASPLHVFI